MNKFLFKVYEYIKFKNMGLPENPNKVFKELLISQFWSEPELIKYQLKKINDLLLFATEESPYYASLYKEVNLPLNSLEQIKECGKIIDKSEIIKNYDFFKTQKFTDKFIGSTSGTTGDPLRIHKSGMTKVMALALHKRFHNWWGVNPYDKNVYIARNKVNSGKSKINSLKEYLRGRLDIDVFDLNENTIFNYVEKIENYKPSYIRGYKSGVLELAELMDRNNIKFTKLNLKVVIVTSEVLYDDEKVYIEKVLGCKVANEYGSVEAGLYAVECQERSMHINEEGLYMYTNELNQAIVTDFDNYSVPLINYRNDDVVYISKNRCSCGRASRVIDKVEGRLSGYIIKNDGTKINQVVIQTIFLELNEFTKENPVKKYQVKQNKNLFTIKMVPAESFNNDCENFVKKRFLEEIGDDIKIKIDLTDKIARDKSGKFRIFIVEK